MNAALVMIGDELLDGRVLDTNSAFFAGRLRELGIPVSVVLISSDELDAIQAKLRFAMSEAQVLIEQTHVLHENRHTNRAVVV